MGNTICYFDMQCFIPYLSAGQRITREALKLQVLCVVSVMVTISSQIHHVVGDPRGTKAYEFCMSLSGT